MKSPNEIQRKHVRQQSNHFAEVLKQARFKRGWKQEDLARRVPVNRRTIVSWETGARIPSAGMVALLAHTLGEANQLPLDHELFLAYLLDDVERQAQRQEDGALQDRVQQVTRQIQQRSEVSRADLQPGTKQRTFSLLPELEPGKETSEESSQAESAESSAQIQHLFTLMDHLRRHPELIGMTNDFVTEMSIEE